MLVGMDQKDYYIGNEALSKKNLLEMSEPVVAGVIQNMDHIEQMLLHIFDNEIRIDP